MARHNRGQGTGGGAGDGGDGGRAPRRVPAPELSRSVPVERAGSPPLATTVVASDDERGRIALRLGIVAVRALEASFTLAFLPDGVVEADGALSARVVQDCVVTLEPFEAPVAERFRVRFVPEARLDPEEVGDPDAIDEIPYEGRAIDLGEATVEQLALALDPFPRAPGAVLDSDLEPDDEAAAASGSGATPGAKDDAAGEAGEAASPLEALARKWARKS